MTTTTDLPPATWTVAALKLVLLEMLAPYLGMTLPDLTARLSAAGQGMPVDSMDLFDVLPDFWKATGLKVRTTELRRSTMSSVDAFIAYVAIWGKK